MKVAAPNKPPELGIEYLPWILIDRVPFRFPEQLRVSGSGLRTLQDSLGYIRVQSLEFRSLQMTKLQGLLGSGKTLGLPEEAATFKLPIPPPSPHPAPPTPPHPHPHPPHRPPPTLSINFCVSIRTSLTAPIGATASSNRQHKRTMQHRVILLGQTHCCPRSI